jgi:hypothetical protein
VARSHKPSAPPSRASPHAAGEEYVVKKHADRDKHDREVHAYRHWIPALGSSAPELVAADPQALTIVTTALDGHPHSDLGSRPSRLDSQPIGRKTPNRSVA